MAGVVHIPWYATILRQDALAKEVCLAARESLRYGATQYAVHQSNDDRYKILQMVWFENKQDWYRYWEGPEMIAFRRRNSGHYQIPIVYIWHDELAADALGPQVPLESESAPEPEPQAAGS
jgi:hypothetical protein